MSDLWIPSLSDSSQSFYLCSEVLPILSCLAFGHSGLQQTNQNCLGRDTSSERTKRLFHNKLVTLPLPQSAGSTTSPGLEFLFSSLFETLWIRKTLYKFKIHILNCWDYVSSQEPPATTVLSLSWLRELPSSSLQPPPTPRQTPDAHSSFSLPIDHSLLYKYLCENKNLKSIKLELQHTYSDSEQ